MEDYKRLTERVGKGIAIKETSTNDNKSIWNAVERLAEIEDKIEDGTLIEFPRIIKNVGYYKFWSVEYINKRYGSISVDFFETKTEAEARLKELKGEV